MQSLSTSETTSMYEEKVKCALADSSSFSDGEVQNQISEISEIKQSQENLNFSKFIKSERSDFDMRICKNPKKGVLGAFP